MKHYPAAKYYYEEYGEWRLHRLDKCSNYCTGRERKQRRTFCFSIVKCRSDKDCRRISQLEYEKRTGSRGWIIGAAR